jgi:hypothetical protein
MMMIDCSMVPRQLDVECRYCIDNNTCNRLSNAFSETDRATQMIAQLQALLLSSHFTLLANQIGQDSLRSHQKLTSTPASSSPSKRSRTSRAG